MLTFIEFSEIEILKENFHNILSAFHIVEGYDYLDTSKMNKEEKEYYEWEQMMNRTHDVIGNVDKYSIEVSGHLQTPRYPPELRGKMTFTKMREEGYRLRGDNISNKTIIETIKKAIMKYPEKIKDKVLIIYKNKKGKYDYLAIRVEKDKISVITAVQDNAFSPNKYSSQQGQTKLIIEKLQSLQNFQNFQILDV